MKSSLVSQTLLLILHQTQSFTTSKVPRQTFLTKAQHSSFPLNALKPSRVSDDDEPTTLPTGAIVDEIDVDSIEELKYDENAHPVPGQPWRRGDTDGCEDPISSAWRVEAEEIIHAVSSDIGAKIQGVTWYMAKCLISVESLDDVEGVVDGPEIYIEEGEDYDESPKGTGQPYFDEPTLTEEEFEDYVTTHPRTRFETFDARDFEEDEIETSQLSALAKVILDAFNDPDVEEKLKITSRHEIVFASAGESSDLLSTQEQFDAFRGSDVMVETRDPFRSNRTLKGKLVERTALDLILNMSGNMVTVPLNFVYQVKLPPLKIPKATRAPQ